MFSHLHRAALFLFLATIAAGQNYTFIRVVDGNTPRPDGGGTFFPIAPSIEGNLVVFNHGAFCASCPSPDSIWAANIDTGALTKLVAKGQGPSGSTVKWDRFEARPVLRKGIVVFQAVDTNEKRGLYAVAATGGTVTRLVDSTATVPGTSILFDTFDRNGFSHDGSTVVFSGGGPGISGIYSLKIDGTGLARVADANTPVNSSQCDVFPVFGFSSPSINANGVIAMGGGTVFDASNGFNALYIGPLQRTVNPSCTPFPSVANSLQPLPGDTTASFHTRFSMSSLDGQTLYFRADDSNSTSGFGGIFSAPATPQTAGNVITKIVDVNTVLPTLGAAPYGISFTFAVSQGNVVFHANGTAGKGNGLFLTFAGAITKLLAFGDTLNGFGVRNVDAPPLTSISGGDVAFTWDRSDFNRELTVARPVTANTAVLGIADSASYRSTTVAPGEVVTVFGTGLGPASLLTAALDSNGKVATYRNGTRIFFDGIPAPLVYTGAANGGQLSAIVPYGIENRQNVSVVAEYQGKLSAPVTVKVAATSPGIYTADSSGAGQGAILNQDNTYNSASNPATVGSTIVIFASGMGQTSPRGEDGLVSGANPPKPTAQVTVSVGGITVNPADIAFQGMAPFAVTGLYQMNFKIPQGVPSGNQPIVLTAAGVSSRNDVTVAIR